MRPFIYHIRPRIYCPGIDAKLINLRIEGLGIHLKADELATGRPYPNKRYRVGRRRIGRKAVDGLLLSLSEWPPDIHIRAQWAINAEYVATHNIVYKLLDEDFEAASDDMRLWYADGGDPFGAPPKFGNRWPRFMKDMLPARAEPCMEVYPREPWQGDELDELGRVVERTGIFALPTIEPARFIGLEHSREKIALPPIETAIRV